MDSRCSPAMHVAGNGCEVGLCQLVYPPVLKSSWAAVLFAMMKLQHVLLSLCTNILFLQADESAYLVPAG